MKYLISTLLIISLAGCGNSANVKDCKPVITKVPVPVYKELPIPADPELELDKYSKDELLSFSDDRISRILESTIVQLKSAYKEAIELIKSTHIDNNNKKD